MQLRIKSPWNLLLVLCLFSFSLAELTPLVAQDPVPAPDRQAEAAKTENEKEEWDHLIYVPFKKIQNALSDKTKVVIPYWEYLKLKAAQQQQVPGLPAVLQKSEYIAVVSGDHVKITANLQFHVWGTERTVYPVDWGNSAIGDLQSAVEGVYLQSDAAGKTGIVFPEAGDYSVSLELLAKVRTAPDGKSFDFNLPTSSITLLDLTLPEAQQQVRVTPAAITEPTTSKAQETRYRGHLKPTSQINVSWFPEVGTRPEMDLLTSVEQDLQVNIEGDIVLSKASFQYDVLRGKMRELEIEVPKWHRILDVTAPGVRLKDWKVKQEDQRQIVMIEFLSPMEKQTTIHLETEQNLKGEKLILLGKNEEGATGSIKASGVVRERGQIRISSVGGLELTVEKQTHLSRIHNQTRNKSSNDSQLAFRFFRSDAELRLSVVQLEPRVLMNMNHQVHARAESLESVVEVISQIEREGVFEQKFSVPEGLTVQYVNGPQVSDYRFDEAAGMLHVFFKKKTLGTIQYKIGTQQIFENPDPDQDEELLLIKALEVEKERGTVSMYASNSLDILPLEDDLVGVSANVQPVARTRGKDRLVYSWRYTERPIEIYFYLHSKPAYMTSTIASTVKIEEESVTVDSLINYRIEHAGVERFQLALPEELTDSVRITPVGSNSVQLFQQAISTEETTAGWTAWEVTTQQPVLGEFAINVRYEVPLGGQEKSEAANRQFQFLPVRVMASTLTEEEESEQASDEEGSSSVRPVSVQGEIAVISAQQLSLQGTIKGENAEAVDVRELRVKRPDATLAFQYYSEPAEVILAIRKYEVQDVLQTVIERSAIDLVIGSDALATYQCFYRIRSSERQRLLVQLPAQSRPLQLRVDGKESALEKAADLEAEEGWDAFYLNVSRTAASDKDFFISLQFTRELDPAPFTSAGGQLQLMLPRFTTDSQDTLVQQTRIGVWVPEEYSLVGTPDQFTQERKNPLHPVLPKNAEQLAKWTGLPSDQHPTTPHNGNGFYYRSLEQVDQIELTWWRNSVYTWIVSGTLFLVALVLVKTSWEHRISLLLCALLLGGLAALSYSDWVWYSLDAGKYGLGFMLILWVTKSCFQLNQAKNAHSTSGEPVELKVESKPEEKNEAEPSESDSPQSEESSSEEEHQSKETPDQEENKGD